MRAGGVNKLVDWADNGCYYFDPAALAAEDLSLPRALPGRTSALRPWTYRLARRTVGWRVESLKLDAWP